MSGYFLAHRALFGNPQFRGKDDEYAALWLISHAAWKPTTIRLARQQVELERGQCAYATSYLGVAWECSKVTAFRILSHLKKSGFLETQGETGYTLITVCNYNEYQLMCNGDETQEVTQPVTILKRGRNAGETNKKELNTVNTLNTKKNNDLFLEFWEKYPSKIRKPKAETAYKRALKRASHEDILSGLDEYKQNKPDWKNYAHPATWLNGDGWNDEHEKEFNAADYLRDQANEH